MGENLYMLPSDTNLNIRSGTVRYNNKILVSNGKFSLGKNDKVSASPANALKPEEETTIHKGSFKNQYKNQLSPMKRKKLH